jgi:hypothetical protein
MWPKAESMLSSLSKPAFRKRGTEDRAPKKFLTGNEHENEPQSTPTPTFLVVEIPPAAAPSTTTVVPMNATTTATQASAPSFFDSVFREITPASMATQVTLAASVYTVLILNLLVPAVRKHLKRNPARWDKMHARPGQALTSTAEETVLAFALAVHHITGGLLMLAGQFLNMPSLWVNGLCIEIGFEVVDIIAILVNAWPYPIVQPKLRAVTILHHIHGLVASPGLVLIGKLHLSALVGVQACDLAL